MEKRNKPPEFWIGIFLGAILSVVLLLLTGTKEGRQFAKKLKRRIEEGDIVDRASELKEQALITASEKTREAAKKSQDVASKIGNKIFRKQGKS